MSVYWLTIIVYNIHSYVLFVCLFVCLFVWQLRARGYADLETDTHVRCASVCCSLSSVERCGRLKLQQTTVLRCYCEHKAFCWAQWVLEKNETESLDEKGMRWRKLVKLLNKHDTAILYPDQTMNRVRLLSNGTITNRSTIPMSLVSG